MAGKVIHVSDDLHSRIKSYCDACSLNMTKWAAYTLDQAIQNRIVPVPKKKLECFQESVPEKDLLSGPPFWKKARS